MAEQNDRIGQIVKKEQKRLLDFIRNRVPTQEDAEDILQDVFFQLSESYRLMKPIEQLSSWLFTVARNKITDLFRKKKPASFSSLTGFDQTDEDGEHSGIADFIPDPDNLESKYLRQLILNKLDEALNELPKEQRDVFMLQEMEQKSFKEIAEMTGEPVNTLISRKRYAVLHLRERLKEVYRELLEK